MYSYAGIGSRKTPVDIGYWIDEIAKYMSSKGWCLRSGGASGADTMFEEGHTGTKEIYLPWPNFNNNHSELFWMGEKCSMSAINIAQKVWESRYRKNNVEVQWNMLKESTRKFMIRNTYQILGANLNDPVKLVICWTPNGAITGGSGQALWLAEMVNRSEKIQHHIVTINLQKEYHREVMRNMIKTDMDPILLWKHKLPDNMP